MNKIGFHYAFWSDNWEIDLADAIKNVADIGCNSIDITPPDFMIEMNKKKMQYVKNIAEERNIDLSFCIGFPKEKDLASSNSIVRASGIDFSKRMIEAVNFMGGKIISGIVYSWWPYLYDHKITSDDKKRAWETSLLSVREVATFANDYDITYAIELVNRFEQYILNSVDEGIQFCEDLQLPYVGLLLDSFHSNIEEDNIPDSIRKAGNLIKHIHISENNRKLPGSTNSMDWPGIFKALRDINYEGRIVVESFLIPFGDVGNDLRIWRSLSNDLSKDGLSKMGSDSINFIKRQLENSKV